MIDGSPMINYIHQHMCLFHHMNGQILAINSKLQQLTSAVRDFARLRLESQI